MFYPASQVGDAWDNVTGTGEIAGSKRTYSKGNDPFPLNDGTQPCGSDSDFAGETNLPSDTIQPCPCESPVGLHLYISFRGASYAGFGVPGTLPLSISIEGSEIIMPVVNTIRCDDNSLVFAPLSGDVEGHLNTGNSNYWVATQEFKAGSTAGRTVGFHQLPGGTGAFWEVLNASETVLGGFYPWNGSDWSSYLYWTQPGTTFGVYLSGGRFQMTGISAGWFSDFVVGEPCSWALRGLTIKCQAGAVAVGSQIGAGYHYHVTTANPPEAHFHAFAGYTVEYDAFRADHWDGGDFVKRFWVDFQGNVYQGFNDWYTGETMPDDQCYLAVRTGLRNGFVSGLAEYNAYAGKHFLAYNQIGEFCFAVESEGQIWTNQVSLGDTLGTVVAKVAIYDAAGVFMGYMPVYDNIT